MSEIITTQPLCWIIDNEGQKHYKECTLEDLASARMQKVDIRVGDSLYIDSEGNLCKRSGEEMLTDYQIAKYGKADIADRFIYFSLPKYPKHIRDKLNVSIANMGREKRKELSYESIRNTVERWMNEEKYYS